MQREALCPCPENLLCRNASYDSSFQYNREIKAFMHHGNIENSFNRCGIAWQYAFHALGKMISNAENFDFNF